MNALLGIPHFKFSLVTTINYDSPIADPNIVVDINMVSNLTSDKYLSYINIPTYDDILINKEISPKKSDEKSRTFVKKYCIHTSLEG
jgi:hypothetical protein